MEDLAVKVERCLVVMDHECTNQVFGGKMMHAMPCMKWRILNVLIVESVLQHAKRRTALTAKALKELGEAIESTRVSDNLISSKHQFHQEFHVICRP